MDAPASRARSRASRPVRSRLSVRPPVRARLSQVHKKVLQILGSKWPQPVQWLLKAPTIHSVFLEQLLKVYPDACIVVTHRKPVEVLPSWTKFVLSPMVATLWRHGTKCARRGLRAGRARSD